MPDSAVQRLRGVLDSARAVFLPRPHAVFSIETLRDLPLDPVRVRALARAQRLGELGPQQIREVAPDLLTDAQQVATRARHSLESGCRLWVLTLRDETTLAALRAQFGDALVALGPSTADGSRAYGITPADAAHRVLTDHPRHASAFDHVEPTGLPHDLLRRLREHLVPIRHRPAASRLLRDPRSYIYLVVLVYSALRALPVVFVKEFTGSVLALWSIDVVTAVPYTWGVIAMVAGRTGQARITGAAMAIATFTAPYVYFGLSGHDYPLYVIVVIALLVLSGVGLELSKFIQERRLQRRYELAAEPLVLSSRMVR